MGKLGVPIMHIWNQTVPFWDFHRSGPYHMRGFKCMRLCSAEFETAAGFWGICAVTNPWKREQMPLGWNVFVRAVRGRNLASHLEGSDSHCIVRSPVGCVDCST